MVVGARFETGRSWTLSTYAGFALTWWLTLCAVDDSLRKRLNRWHHTHFVVLVAPAIAAVWLWVTRMPREFDYRQLATAVAAAGAGLLIQGLVHRQFRRSGTPVAEAFRLLAILGVSLWIIQPYAGTRLVGGGDALHYAQQVADAAEQARNGEFQLFVGQTSFAFNGDFHPLRTAPYFSYVGAAVGLLAGPALPPTGILNLLIVLSFCAAVGGLYLLLSVLRPGAGWPTFWLTIAFAANPGVLALIYSGDMVASWLALPWLPVVFYAAIRSGSAANPTPALGLLAGSIAAIWLAHPAIAFWTTVLVALPLTVNLLMRWDGGKNLWRLVACASACLLLCSYVLVSVKTLSLPSDPTLVANVRKGAILATLESGWARIGRPIDSGGSDLTGNLQLSPALWLAGLVGLVGVAAGHRHRRTAGMLIVGAAGMLLLLYPSKLIAGRLWSVMPEIVINATDQWPMQRFYPILSALVPFVAVVAWPIPTTLRRRRFAQGLLYTLAAATALSCYDARKFIARGYAVTNTADMSDRRLRTENVVLSRYSYEYYGSVPQMFSHGTQNPLMQNRFLARKTLEPIDINFMALRAPIPGGGPRIRTRHRYVATDYGGTYEPAVRLEPNQTYFARFLFKGEEARGTLQLLGRYIAREYNLPFSGASQAFGIGSQRRNGFTLWTTGAEVDNVQIRFYAEPGRPKPANLGDLELLSVKPDRLPIQTLSVYPYQVFVHSPADTWLETPKIFISGYEAYIDGRPAPVMRSPDGLAMVAVTSGSHRVHLTYVGPTTLRIAYWVTLIAWMIYGGLWWYYHHSPRMMDKIFLILGRLGLSTLVVAGAAFGATRGYTALQQPAPPPDLALRPMSIEFTLPNGLTPNWEPVWHFDRAGERWDVYLFYEGNQKIRVGLGRNGALFAESPLFSINYLRRHCMVAQLFPGPLGEANSSHLRLWVNNRLVLSPVLNHLEGGRVVKTAPFRGEILRVAPSAGPIE